MFDVERRAVAAVVGIVGILLELGCSSSPLDAILPVDAGAEPIGSGGAPPTVCGEPVTTVTPGLYNVVLDASGQCLALGDETQIAGTLVWGNEVILVADCAQPGTEFRIRTTGGAGFELRNVESELALDIEGYETAPSTRAILFDPTDNLNQRFYFSRYRSALGVFSIAPAHAFGQCLTATSALEVQIWACQEGPFQGWRLVPTDCE